jgi:excisionase family DNA binding protein
MSGPERQLLTIPEAAALMGVSRSIAYEMARQGQLPGLVRLSGHRMLVRRRVLESWLAGE